MRSQFANSPNSERNERAIKTMLLSLKGK